jgi:hypothetical protein
MKRHGEFLTRRLVLQGYDALAETRARATDSIATTT